MFTRRDFMVGTGAVLTSAAVTQSSSAATAFDLATVWPDGNFHTTNAKQFAEEVAKATGGEVKITVQAGGSLRFKGPGQLRAVRDGLRGVGGAGLVGGGGGGVGPVRQLFKHAGGGGGADARHRVDPVSGR